MTVVSFNRTLEQELLALARGVSLECLVCGEFVLHRTDGIVCGECGSRLHQRVAVPGAQGEQRELWAG